MRGAENRTPHSYPDLASAVRRMKEANPFLSDAVAEHLTLHGTNWNADGSIIWKFDNFARLGAPYGMNAEEAAAVMSRITCPVLLFWGRESLRSGPGPRAGSGCAARSRASLKWITRGTGCTTISSTFFCARRRSFWRSERRVCYAGNQGARKVKHAATTGTTRQPFFRYPCTYSALKPLTDDAVPVTSRMWPA